MFIRVWEITVNFHLLQQNDGGAGDKTPLCSVAFNPLNPELNPICYLLALLAHHFLHVSTIRVKSLTIRLLMSYMCIYIYDISYLRVKVQYQVTICIICCTKYESAAEFSKYLRFSLNVVIPTSLPEVHDIITRQHTPQSQVFPLSQHLTLHNTV